MDVNGAAETSFIVTYKPTSTTEEGAAMVEAFFGLDLMGPAPHVRFINEVLVSASMGKGASAMVIDIGEQVKRVVPVYEGVMLEAAIQTAAMEGADLTNYMAYMLLSLLDDTFSSLVERKLLEAPGTHNFLYTHNDDAPTTTTTNFSTRRP